MEFGLGNKHILDAYFKVGTAFLEGSDFFKLLNRNGRCNVNAVLNEIKCQSSL